VVSPSLTIVPGASGSYPVSAAPQDGFTGQINLSVSGLPPGAAAAFSPANLSGGGISTLSITASGSTPSGSYVPNVTGGSGALIRIVPVTLNIGTAPDFTLTSTPSSQSVTAGQSANFTIAETPSNGFTQIIGLRVSGL